MTDLRREISRRSMLKRIGAGAAVAWTAPVLTSIRTPAFAQASARCADCSRGCGELALCGDECLCIRTIEGGCFCGNDFGCGSTPQCQTSADCPSGWACQGPESGCCGPNVCVPPCGTQVDSGIGPTNAGR